jgi:hypothetical protein
MFANGIHMYLYRWALTSLRFVVGSAPRDQRQWSKVQKSAHRLLQISKVVGIVVVSQATVQIVTIALRNNITSWYIVNSLSRAFLLAIPALMAMGIQPSIGNTNVATTLGGGQVALQVRVISPYPTMQPQAITAATAAVTIVYGQTHQNNKNNNNNNNNNGSAVVSPPSRNGFLTTSPARVPVSPRGKVAYINGGHIASEGTHTSTPLINNYNNSSSMMMANHNNNNDGHGAHGEAIVRTRPQHKTHAATSAPPIVAGGSSSSSTTRTLLIPSSLPLNNNNNAISSNGQLDVDHPNDNLTTSLPGMAPQHF